MRRLLFLMTIFYLILVWSPLLYAQAGPQNLDFEQAEVSYIQGPSHWFVGPNQRDYSVTLDTLNPYQGRYCAIIQSLSTPTKKESGKIVQFIDATPYRGKYLRYQASVRCNLGPDGDARMVLRATRPNNTFGFFNSVADRPIKSKTWEKYEIFGRVPEDATDIYFGCQLSGTGLIAVDAVYLEVISASEAMSKIDSPLKEFQEFSKINGLSESVKTSDIRDIIASQNTSIINLKSGRQLTVFGDYTWLSQLINH